METIFEEAPICGKCVWSRPTIGCKVIGLDKSEHYYTLGCVYRDDDPSCPWLTGASRADKEKDFNSSFHPPQCEKWRLH